MSDISGYVLFLVAILALAIFLRLFGDKIAARMALGKRASEVPMVGQKWMFIKGDRFDYPPVLVKDVSEGVVLFDMSFMGDQRLKLDSFMRMYRRVS